MYVTGSDIRSRSTASALFLTIICVVIAAMSGAVGAFMYAAYCAPDELRIART